MLSFLLTSTLHCVTNFIIISGKHYYLWSPGAAADILEVKNASLVYCWTWLRAMVGGEAWSASSTSVSTLPIFITTATINIIRWLLSLCSPPLLFQWEYSIVLEQIFWNWYYQLCALSSFRDPGLASSSFLLGSKTQLTIYWLSNITKHLFKTTSHGWLNCELFSPQSVRRHSSMCYQHLINATQEHNAFLVSNIPRYHCWHPPTSCPPPTPSITSQVSTAAGWSECLLTSASSPGSWTRTSGQETRVRTCWGWGTRRTCVVRSGARWPGSVTPTTSSSHSTQVQTILLLIQEECFIHIYIVSTY